MNKKYAIFDMDGTVVDSMYYWRHLPIEWLETKGIFVNNQKDFLKKIRLMNLIQIANFLIDNFKIDMNPEDIRTEMNALMEVHYKNDVVIKNGMDKYLEELHQKGVKMCIASATPEWLIEICLGKVKVRKYFDFVLSCKTVKASKSKPTIYLESAKRLAGNVKVEDIAVFEDSLYAATTAKNAGFYVVGLYEKTNDVYWNDLKNLADEIIE